MEELLPPNQPDTLAAAVEVTRYAGLRIIDDYVGFEAVQEETAQDIATLLFEPGTDYYERLDTYEFINRSATELVDEFELIAAIYRMDKWTGQNELAPPGLVKNICVATELATGYRRVHRSFSEPSTVRA